MNETDVRAHSHGVNESMSNTDSDKKQRTKLQKRQLKLAVSTGKKQNKKYKIDCYGDRKPVPAECRPQIFQSIETSCLRASFHWRWPSLCVSALTAARVHSSHPWVCTQLQRHNVSQEAFMSTQGRTQQTWWDLRYRRPKVRGQYSLMFSLKWYFRTTFREGFVFSTLVQISTWIQRWTDVAATSCFQMLNTTKTKRIFLHVVRWIDSLHGAENMRISL